MADVGDKGKYKKKIRRPFPKVCMGVAGEARRLYLCQGLSGLIVDLQAIYHLGAGYVWLCWCCCAFLGLVCCSAVLLGLCFRYLCVSRPCELLFYDFTSFWSGAVNSHGFLSCQLSALSWLIFCFPLRHIYTQQWLGS